MKSGFECKMLLPVRQPEAKRFETCGIFGWMVDV